MYTRKEVEGLLVIAVAGTLLAVIAITCTTLAIHGLS